jgi:organic radical activating enzyme
MEYNMYDKIKRFIECKVPISACNLRCHYCYITQNKKFSDKIPKFPYSSDFFGRAISVERLGGICLINFCADGETLLPPEMPLYIHAALKEGHFVSVVTNGTLDKRFDELISLSNNLSKRLFFKFSFQYFELRKRNLIDSFFNNIKKVKESGCSFTLELTPSDELEPYINEIMEISEAYLGAACHVTIARDERNKKFPILTNHTKEEYKRTWRIFDSELFDYKISVFGEKRREFCYAGEWSGYINIFNGDFTQCCFSFYKQNIYKKIDAPLKYLPLGNHCRRTHCHNAHVFLTLGVIPELVTPTYTAMRNRICSNGTEWLQPEVKYFFNSKLSESNKNYSLFGEIFINIINSLLEIISLNKRLINKIILIWKIEK